MKYSIVIGQEVDDNIPIMLNTGKESKNTEDADKRLNCSDEIREQLINKSDQQTSSQNA